MGGQVFVATPGATAWSRWPAQPALRSMARDLGTERIHDHRVFRRPGCRGVEELEVPPAGEPLREVLDISDRLMAKTALALGYFDAAEGYEIDGATSTTAWLRHLGGRSSRAAARLAPVWLAACSACR